MAGMMGLFGLLAYLRSVHTEYLTDYRPAGVPHVPARPSKDDRRESIPVKVPPPKTYVVNPKFPTSINGRYELLSIRGTGKMKELMVRSDNIDFTVHVKVDGENMYQDTWSELRDISQPVGEIIAFVDENGKYVVNLTDIEFAEELIIRFYGVFTAERMFLKYDLYPPRGRRYHSIEDENVQM